MSLIVYKNLSNYNNNLFSNIEKSKIVSTVIQFCNSNNNFINKRFYDYKNNDLFKKKIENNILKTLDIIAYPKMRTTTTDELTSIFLEDQYLHLGKDREIIQQQYANQKQAEMYIGNLLELYIQKEGLLYEWCCSGSVLKDIDFIRKEKNNSWSIYQIKNRDNTENNAASKVRHGTNIKKWYRNHSKKKDYFFWDIFPDDKLVKVLSEEGFRKFIKNYFNKITIIKQKNS